MMRWTPIVLSIALGLGTARAEPPAEVSTADQKLGYGIGYQIGGDFRRSGRTLDADELLAGVRDALAGTTPKWTAAEMREALRRLEEAESKRDVPSPSRED